MRTKFDSPKSPKMRVKYLNLADLSNLIKLSAPLNL